MLSLHSTQLQLLYNFPVLNVILFKTLYISNHISFTMATVRKRDIKHLCYKCTTLRLSNIMLHSLLYSARGTYFSADATDTITLVV